MTDRPTGLIERLVASVEMCETYLGLLAKGGMLPAKGGEKVHPDEMLPTPPVVKKPVTKKKEVAAAVEVVTEDPNKPVSLSPDVLATMAKPEEPAVLTFDWLKQAATRFQRVEGREKAIELIHSYNVTNISSLNPKDFSEFWNICWNAGQAVEADDIMS